MEKLSHFLSRYVSMTPPDMVVRRACVVAIEEETGITLDRNQVRVRDAIIYLTVHPAERHTIVLKKKSVLKKLKETLKENSVRDIR